MYQHIGIIIGGNNSEREVSKKSGENVAQSLIKSGYSVDMFSVPEDLPRFLVQYTKLDFVFVMIHGLDGEDGKIPALLELLGIPFQWSPSSAHAIGMQKDKTKQIWQAHQLPLAKDSLIACAGKTIEELQEIIEADIGFPCVIKSCVEGSSRGVFILLTPQDLVKKYSEIQQYTGELLLEAFLRGEEYTVSILEREGETIALPVIAIVPPANEEFDFENKYNGKTQEICPAPISDDMAKKMQEVAIKAHKAIGARGYSRVDIIWSEGVPYLLEINTIPGFTSESLFPKAARAVGISFEELLQILMTNNK